MSYENIGNGIPMREIRAINTENKIRKKEQEMQKERNIVEGKIPQKLLDKDYPLCWVLISYL